MPGLVPSHEWTPATFVATKDGCAVISLMMAIHPGQGAWTRLLARLKANYPVVMIVAPISERFTARLARDGFHQTMPGVWIFYRP